MTEQKPCPVAGCQRPMWAKGLCIYHYKRQRAGKPLEDEPKPAVGSPSGHGRYGIVDRDEHQVLCHECGEWFASVSGHIPGAHQMTVAEYRKRHGLPQRLSLLSIGASRRKSEEARARLGSAGWAKFEQSRDPVAASHARTAEAFVRRGQDAADHAKRARANGRLNVALEYPCLTCGTPVTGRATCSDECLSAWLSSVASRQRNDTLRELTLGELEKLHQAGSMIRSLQLDGVRSRDIAQALGMSPTRISEHLPLPPEEGRRHRSRYLTDDEQL